MLRQERLLGASRQCDDAAAGLFEMHLIVAAFLVTMRSRLHHAGVCRMQALEEEEEEEEEEEADDRGRM
jgi:hypothetical protein